MTSWGRRPGLAYRAFKRNPKKILGTKVPGSQHFKGVSRGPISALVRHMTHY